MSIFSDIKNYPKAWQEFSLLCMPIRDDMRNPEITREEKRKILNTLVESLSEETLKNGKIADSIITIISMKKDICDLYPSTRAQLDSIYQWCPRMKLHEGRLLKAINKNRKLYNLYTGG